MKKHSLFFIILSIITSVGCQQNSETGILEGEIAGGDATVFVAHSGAFSQPAPNLTAAQLELHRKGDVAFEATFVTNPSPANGGLGSIFNNNSCVACHTTDGRAAFPVQINEFSGLFLKISIPGTDEHGGPIAVPGFGTQLQHQSVYGFQSEGKMQVSFVSKTETLADGTEIILRKPVFSIINPYIPLPSEVLLSPRIGMPVFGLGLLEAIPEETILANADAMDADGDSISGRPNYVWDPANQKMALGRFGWKANNPTVLVQSAGAYNQDMGVTNPLMPVECSFGQSNYDTSSVSPEITRETLDEVTFYCLTLGVPAVRNITDPQVIEGRKIFERLECTSCHIPSFTTGNYPDIPQLSNQKIYPYSDLLLHDMGEDLADNRPDFTATGREWKTRPLWGIGLTQITSGHTTFLHDGRANSITEAILWHGGEAQKSKEAFKKLSADEREAVLKFIQSL